MGTDFFATATWLGVAQWPIGPLDTALLATVGHMQELGRAFLGCLAAPVVTRGGLDLRVTRQLLNGAQVGASVEEITDERAAKVV